MCRAGEVRAGLPPSSWPLCFLQDCSWAWLLFLSSASLVYFPFALCSGLSPLLLPHIPFLSLTVSVPFLLVPAYLSCPDYIWSCMCILLFQCYSGSGGISVALCALLLFLSFLSPHLFGSHCLLSATSPSLSLSVLSTFQPLCPDFHNRQQATVGTPQPGLMHLPT